MKTFVLMMVSLLFAISSEAQNKSFYDFTVKTIDGKDLPLSSLKGKKVRVVNVASKCGLTPQYAQLEKLYEKYKEKDFVVIGFPANNFMGQEPVSYTHLSATGIAADSLFVVCWFPLQAVRTSKRMG